jgi:hypothetical protein
MTTLSGGKAKIRDKVDRIVPLFHELTIRIADRGKRKLGGKLYI